MATESAKTGEISHTPGHLTASNAYGGGSAFWIAPNDGAAMVLQGAQCLRADTVKYEEISVDQLQANARRLVACWNSFDGVPTDLIESLPKMGTATLPYRILQARGEALALSIEAFLDPQGNPPAATGEWAEAVAALAAFRAPRKESEL